MKTMFYRNADKDNAVIAVTMNVETLATEKPVAVQPVKLTIIDAVKVATPETIPADAVVYDALFDMLVADMSAKVDALNDSAVDAVKVALSIADYERARRRKVYSVKLTHVESDENVYLISCSEKYADVDFSDKAWATPALSDIMTFFKGYLVNLAEGVQGFSSTRFENALATLYHGGAVDALRNAVKDNKVSADGALWAGFSDTGKVFNVRKGMLKALVNVKRNAQKDTVEYKADSNKKFVALLFGNDEMIMRAKKEQEKKASK